MTVPVRNLFYLLCYAWDELWALGRLQLGAIEADRPIDLFAKVLIEGTAHTLRRGLDRGYAAHEEEIAALRGKLLVSQMAKRVLSARGSAACSFDEFTHDVLHNRILKATLRSVLQVDALDASLRRDLNQMVRRLPEITDISVEATDFRNVQIHRNNAHYRLLMNVCEIVRRNLLVDRSTGRYEFKDLRGNEQEMGTVFEGFVRNFLRREQVHFRVGRDEVRWRLDRDSDDSRWLPEMRTDVTLRSPDRTVLIETKYYAEPLQKRFGKQTIRSTHLYQLFSYLKNCESRGGPDGVATGLLLYPTVDRPLDLEFAIHGHRVLVKSLDLNQLWHGIRSDLLGLADSLA